VHVLIADLTSTASWTTASLEGLRDAHRDLAARGTELRVVVWSSELYGALQATGVTARVPVFPNVESALRAPADNPPDR
jgi:STAS domain